MLTLGPASAGRFLNSFLARRLEVLKRGIACETSVSVLWYLLNFVNCNCNLATLPCWLNTFLLLLLLLLSYYSELYDGRFVDAYYVVDRKAPFCELKRALFVSVFVFADFVRAQASRLPVLQALKRANLLFASSSEHAACLLAC